MFEAIRRWWVRRHHQRLAYEFARSGTGFQSMVVPFNAMTPIEARNALALDVEAWLAHHLTRTATPYGLTHYTVCLGYIQFENRQRMLIHRWQREIEDRTLAASTFAAAADAIRTDPIPPTTTALEIYLFSAGDVLKALLNRKNSS